MGKLSPDVLITDTPGAGIKVKYAKTVLGGKCMDENGHLGLPVSGILD